MKLIHKNQQGFAALEVLLVVVVVAIVGFAAYRLLNRASSSSSNSGNNTVATETQLPSKINTRADVAQAIRALDDTPISQKLDPSQLDSNLTKLL